MIGMACPDDDAKRLFEELALHTQDRALRAALVAEGPRVERRAREYLRLAEAGDLSVFGEEDPVGVTAAQLSGVYDRVLVGGFGRPTYDRIKASAKFRRCPLCGHRIVKTLDHYLPQTKYPELAVYPANLVPACADCNKSKLAHVAQTRIEETFHPYFDNWGEHCVLGASLEIDEGLTVSYQILDAPGMSPVDMARARHHFDILQLNELYSSHAAAELSENKELYRSNFESGPDALRDELLRIATARSRANLNSWMAGLYRCLAESEDFYTGGFQQIEE
ncbi:HNH endonuclease [Paraburkholderia phytofirmans]|uniref:HNH endonuclease n=1 Tax=Paraburkholderia phytofirmans TaxID=261302 RepID=UPI0038B9EB78